MTTVDMISNKIAKGDNFEISEECYKYIKEELITLELIKKYAKIEVINGQRIDPSVINIQLELVEDQVSEVEFFNLLKGLHGVN